MTAHMAALCFRTNDPDAMAAFWSAMLGQPITRDRRHLVLRPTPATGFEIRFHADPVPKTIPNSKHVDLTSSSISAQQHMVDRALAAGGQYADVGQGQNETHVVLADPEGNEFCVIEPGNRFLAGCGAFGAVACDGSRRTGHFWSEAVNWPLVWDQDDEAAIQATPGTTKISWGAPRPRVPASERLYFALAPDPGSSLEQESQRLQRLGANLTRTCPDAKLWMTDPDGYEFCMEEAP
ncbi:MAG: VOC family protein [Actinomycetales bacterium]